MKRYFVIFAVFHFLLTGNAGAQAPVASLTVPSQACLGEKILPVNSSTGAARYEWDFCQGDLSLAPSVASLGSVGGAVTTGIDVVSDGTNWYGFVASRETGSIIRLDFGNDYNSIPTHTDLGNVSGVLGRPVDIKVVKDGGNWYGFVYSESTSLTLISRINFGNSLQNTTSSTTPITATIVLPGNGVVNTNGGFDMVQDGSTWVIVYTQPSFVGLIRLSSITAIPGGGDELTSSSFPDTNASSTLGDIKILKTSTGWFAYTPDFTNKVLYRLSFGFQIFSLPVADFLGNSYLAGFTPFGLDGGYDNGNYYLMVSTLEGSLVRINLGTDLTQAPVSGTSLGNLGQLGFTFKIKLFSYQSQWIAFALDYSLQRLFRIPFPSPACGTSPAFSAATTPSLIYSTAGQDHITLRSYNADGNYDEASAGITVLPGTAPVIDFQAQNSCAQFPVNFTAQSSQVLNNFIWDFGNGDVSSQATPSETFATHGSYLVTVSAAAPDGCRNLVQKSISVYTIPVADFSLPAPALSCTNQQYVFQNTSVTDNGSLPTWQWNVNGSPYSITKDLAVAFTTIATQTIQLVASLPGCSTQSTQSFTIQQTGPAVAFNAASGCSGQVVSFNNTSSGTISGYSWSFGDGSTSVATAPQNTYASIGNYTVTLTASDPLGCNNSATKQLPVFSTPQPDFSLDLPPFSCSGTPSQFTDTTPLMTDSNESSWAWSFGDAAGGTSAAQNPAYTYATGNNYLVQLKVGTDRGCTASVQKSVTISATPIADFSFSAACAGQSTQFTDASGSSIKSWNWNINGTVSNIQNPTYVFNTSSDYAVKLTVTANNNCIAQVSKNVSVPVPPALTFSGGNLCSGQVSVFDDTTTGGDPAASTSWTISGTQENGSSVLFIFPLSGNATVTLQRTATSGCIYQVTKTISVFKSPVASFTTSADHGGPPLFVQFTNTSTDATSYEWDISDVVSSEAAPSYTFNSTGDYQVRLTATGDGGCVSEFVKTISVAVPDIDIALDSVSFSFPSPGELRGHFVLSNLGNVVIVNPVLTITAPGSFSNSQTFLGSLAPGEQRSGMFEISSAPVQPDFICVTVSTSGDTDQLDNEQCVNFGEQQIVFEPWPNPATDQLHFNWIATTADESSRVSVFTTLGQPVFTQEITSATAGLNQVLIDVSALNSGIYILELVVSGKRKTYRVVVRKG